MLCELNLVALFEEDICLFAAGGRTHAVGAAGHDALARYGEQGHFARGDFVDFFNRGGNRFFIRVFSNIKSVRAGLGEVGALFGDARRYDDVSGVFCHKLFILSGVGGFNRRLLAEHLDNIFRRRNHEIFGGEYGERVKVARLLDGNVAEVAEGFDGCDIARRERDERGVFFLCKSGKVFAQRRKDRFARGGLRHLHLDLVDKDNLAVFILAREHGQKGLGRHGAVYLLRVDFVIARAVGHAAALPDRRAAGAVAGASGALLLPRFFAAAAHLAAVFGMGDVRARVGLHGKHKLMHQVGVPPQAENIFRRVELPHRLTLHVVKFRFHIFYPRISTTVPFRPGTAPLITNSWVSGCTCKTDRLRTDTRSWPMRPAMRIPLATRPPARPPPPPIEPGLRSECFWPCERGPPWKPWRLTTPWKPRPLEIAETVTLSPTAKTETSMVEPTSGNAVSGLPPRVAGRGRISRNTLSALPLVWPSCALLTCLSVVSPAPTCMAA